MGNVQKHEQTHVLIIKLICSRIQNLHIICVKSIREHKTKIMDICYKQPTIFKVTLFLLMMVEILFLVGIRFQLFAAWFFNSSPWLLGGESCFSRKMVDNTLFTWCRGVLYTTNLTKTIQYCSLLQHFRHTPASRMVMGSQVANVMLGITGRSYLANNRENCGRFCNPVPGNSNTYICYSCPYCSC